MKQNITRRTALAALTSAVAVALPGMSFAQADRPIKFILPNATGSGVDAITVYKSLLPYMDGDAIGGTIDIKTPTAFDYAPTYAAGSIEGTLLQQRDDRTSWAADVALGKQFSDRLGLYVTGNYSERGSQFEQIGNSGDNMPRTWYSTTHSLDFDPKTFVARGLEMSTGDVQAVLDEQGFRDDANRVLRMVHERMQRENREFYPRIEAL